MKTTANLHHVLKMADSSPDNSRHRQNHSPAQLETHSERLPGASSRSSKRSFFLELPPELRNQIYELVLVHCGYLRVHAPNMEHLKSPWMPEDIARKFKIVKGPVSKLTGRKASNLNTRSNVSHKVRLEEDAFIHPCVPDL